MDTLQLEYVASRLCPEFIGCVAADMVTPKNGYYIVNVGKKNTEGSHWVCMYFNETCSEAFDPAGIAPSIYHESWDRMLLSHGGKYKYNSKPVQAPLTSTCGQFVLYYLFHRYNGQSMESIVHSLENGMLKGNEEKVTKFLTRLIHKIV